MTRAYLSFLRTCLLILFSNRTMSLDIEWGKLDQELAAHVQHFLNRHFKSITKPAFIGDIEVTAFEWGTETPQIEITNITDPFPEFYEPENDDGDASVSEKGHSRIPSSSLPPPSPAMAPSARGAEMYRTEDDTDMSAVGSINSSSSNSHLYPGRLSFHHSPLLSQQQRFNLIHAFHRSPFVAPQHPFHHHPNHYSPPQHLTYFSSPSSPQHGPTFGSPYSASSSSAAAAAATTVMSTTADESNPSNSLYQQDWIDEDTEPSATAAAAPPSVVNSSTQSKSKAAQLHDPSELDFQASMRISYKGDMSMTLLTELRMNYPSMMFMSLPIQLRVRSVEFEATAVVAYIKSMDRVCVSMLEPDQSDMDLNSGPGHDIGLESLLRKVHIESIVGDSQKQVLKNVGKIEKFIVDQLRKMLDDELVFPSYQCVQLD